MKHLFISLLFICTTNVLVAQEPLSSMPKEKRDSILLEITQKLVREKFPKYYHTDIVFSVTQSDFKFLNSKCLTEGWPDSYFNLPDYLKPEDLSYRVTLYYQKEINENYHSTLRIETTIIDKSHEVYRIYLEELWAGYRWHVLKDMKGEEPLSSMPKEKRDSILVEISQNILKEKYPESYREDIYPIIDQGDFKLKDVKWVTDTRLEFAPDYVGQDDIFYEVTLYYEKWREEGFKEPFTAVVYIVGKTKEPYRIQLNTREYKNLLKPNE